MQAVLREKYIALIERRKLVVKDLPNFLRRTSVLLNEGYVLSDCMTMLLPYHVKDYSYWQTILQQHFQKGASVVELFSLFGVKKRYLLAIQLAEVSGELAEVLKSVSEQLIFDMSVKEKLKKLLSYPTILFCFLVLLFIGFRLYFMPNILAMFSSKTTEETNISGVQWSQFFLKVPDYIIILFVVTGVSGIFFTIYINRKRVDLQVDLLMAIPLVRYGWMLILTRQFARSIGSLLMTGLSLQQALEYLKEQQIQKQISYIASLIEQRIIYGDTLASAINMHRFFYPKFAEFVDHGEKSGMLARELMLYCELLDSKIAKVIEKAFSIIQPLLFSIIAICIVAAYLSILLPMYNLLDFI